MLILKRVKSLFYLYNSKTKKNEIFIKLPISLFFFLNRTVMGFVAGAQVLVGEISVELVLTNVIKMS